MPINLQHGTGSTSTFRSATVYIFEYYYKYTEIIQHGTTDATTTATATLVLQYSSVELTLDESLCQCCNSSTITGYWTLFLTVIGMDRPIKIFVI
jgi:hypothetical protein